MLQFLQKQKHKRILKVEKYVFIKKRKRKNLESDVPNEEFCSIICKRKKKRKARRWRWIIQSRKFQHRTFFAKGHTSVSHDCVLCCVVLCCSVIIRNRRFQRRRLRWLHWSDSPRDWRTGRQGWSNNQPFFFLSCCQPAFYENDTTWWSRLGLQSKHRTSPSQNECATFVPSDDAEDERKLSCVVTMLIESIHFVVRSTIIRPSSW